MKTIGKVFGFQLLLLMVFCAIAADASADEVMDSINEAIMSYQDGKYTDAVESLDYASQMIRQKRSELLKTLLPEPLQDWTADNASSESTGLAMLGGVLSAKRVYRKGLSRVTIEITDSPALQNIMAMFTNLVFTTTGGGRLKRIGGQKVMIKYAPDTHDGDVTVMIENRCMLSVKGENVSEQNLIDYASAVNYKKLKQF
ncbi:MAG: hypothetical protein LJE96_20355 [Deltaproteobacteria bacterium]|nr:hypothetical protein [Deltaproteobacteria bacterium]